jgi:hypothetical protein
VSIVGHLAELASRNKAIVEIEQKLAEKRTNDVLDTPALTKLDMVIEERLSSFKQQR